MQNLRLNLNDVENQADKALPCLNIILVWFMYVSRHFHHFFSFIGTIKLIGKGKYRQTYRTDR